MAEPPPPRDVIVRRHDATAEQLSWKRPHSRVLRARLTRKTGRSRRPIFPSPASPAQHETETPDLRISVRLGAGFGVLRVGFASGGHRDCGRCRTNGPAFAERDPSFL